MLNRNIRGKLFFTIGTAKSGKSTWCDEWIKYGVHVGNEGLVTPRVIVSDDDIRMALYNKRYEAECEPMVFAVKSVMIRALLSRGMNVMVDDTHTTEQSVRRLFEIDNAAQYKRFETPPGTSKTRAYQFGFMDLFPVIERHWSQLNKMSDKRIEEIRAEVISASHK